MATTTYTINVQTSGAQASINNLQNSFINLGKTSNNLGSIISTAFAGGAIAAMVKLSDSVTLVNNRLQTISKSQSDVNNQFNAMAAIAITTRTSLDSVTTVYNKMMMASDTLGINQKQAAEYTTTLAQSLKLTGATAAETNSTLIQFSQGLAKGTFNGDELNSILENNIVITQALAKEMGVSTTEVKRLGSEGKITAQVMLRALGGSADEIRAKFAKMTPTINESFGVLQVVGQKVWNEFEKETETGKKVSASIMYIAYSMDKLAKNTDSIVGPLGTFVKIIGTLLAFSAVGRVLTFIGSSFTAITSAIRTAGGAIGLIIKSFKDFWIVITNLITKGSALASTLGGWGAVFSGLGVGISILTGRLWKFVAAALAIGGAIASWLGLDKLGEIFNSLGDDTSQISKDMKTWFDELLKSTGNLDDKSKQSSKDREEASKKVTEQISRETAALQKQVQAYKDLIVSQTSDIKIATLKVNMPESDLKVMEDSIKAFDDYRNAYNQMQADIEAKRATGSEADLAMIPKLQEAQKTLTKEYENSIPIRAKLTQEELAANRAYEIGTKLYNDRYDLVTKIKDVQQEMKTSVMTPLQKIESDIMYNAQKKLEADVKDLELQRKEKISVEEYNKLQEASKQGAIDLYEQQKAQYEQSRSFESGWTNAFNTYVAEGTNAAKITENLFNKAMSGLEDQIFNLAKTGKFAWKDLAQSLSDEFLKSSIRATLASVLGGAASDGSILGSLFGGGPRGQSVSNPMYVLDVSGGGFNGGSSGGGGGLFGDLFGGSSSGSSSGGGFFDGLVNTVGDIFSGIGDFFGGLFADGGNLAAGKWGIVGENGPEVIKGPASVIGNKDLGSLGSQTYVTYNINAVDARSFKQMIAADPGFIHAVAMQGANQIPGRR